MIEFVDYEANVVIYGPFDLAKGDHVPEPGDNVIVPDGGKRYKVITRTFDYEDKVVRVYVK